MEIGDFAGVSLMGSALKTLQRLYLRIDGQTGRRSPKNGRICQCAYVSLNVWNWLRGLVIGGAKHGCV